MTIDELRVLFDGLPGDTPVEVYLTRHDPVEDEIILTIDENMCGPEETSVNGSSFILSVRL